MRQLAIDAAMSLASVSRYLKAMHEEGVFQRERLPGGGRYRYTLVTFPRKSGHRVMRISGLPAPG